jgi:hypothetical protein
MTVTDEMMQQLVEGFLENMPRKTSDRYFAGNTTTVLAGTQLTATFTLDKTYVVRLVKAYADARTGCTYQWWINGLVFVLNEIEFHMGKPVTGDSIILIYANPTAADVVIMYSIQGWGDSKSGG